MNCLIENDYVNGLFFLRFTIVICDMNCLIGNEYIIMWIPEIRPLKSKYFI